MGKRERFRKQSISKSGELTTRSLFHSQSTTGRTPRSPDLNPTPQLSQRFLKLQRDLRSAGYAIESPPYSDEFVLDSKDLIASYSPEGGRTIDFMSGSRISAVPVEVDLTRSPALPQLQWCSYCRTDVVTITEYHSTRKTWYVLHSLASTGICLSGGFLGCFLIPYCTDSCKAPMLTCSRCKKVLGLPVEK